MEQLNNLDNLDRFHTTLFRGFLCQLTIDRDTRGSGIQMSKIAKRPASITFLTHVLVSMVSMVSRYFHNHNRILQENWRTQSIAQKCNLFSDDFWHFNVVQIRPQPQYARPRTHIRPKKQPTDQEWMCPGVFTKFTGTKVSVQKIAGL